jgi:hypothetical protein
VLGRRDDHVIDQRDPDTRSRIADATSQVEILATWGWVAGRVIVCEHKRGGIQREGNAQDVATTNRAAVASTAGHAGRTAGGVMGVEGQQPELFVVEASEAGP